MARESATHELGGQSLLTLLFQQCALLVATFYHFALVGDAMFLLDAFISFATPQQKPGKKSPFLKIASNLKVGEIKLVDLFKNRLSRPLK
jgi:hypothetical protein